MTIRLNILNGIHQSDYFLFHSEHLRRFVVGQQTLNSELGGLWRIPNVVLCLLNKGPWFEFH